MTMNNHLTAPKHLKLTLVRSLSGRLPKHRATIAALGLKRIGQSNTLRNNQALLGMIRVVSYLITVEEV